MPWGESFGTWSEVASFFFLSLFLIGTEDAIYSGTLGNRKARALCLMFLFSIIIPLMGALSLDRLE